MKFSSLFDFLKRGQNLKMLSNAAHFGSPLTLCILMDFPIHIVTISMGLPIVYLKGSLVEISKL